jgi:hypothetical protein
MSRKVEDKIAHTGRFHVNKNRFGPDGITFPATINTNTGTIEIYDTNTHGGKETQGKMNNADEYIRKTLAQKKKDFDNYSQDSDIEDYSQEENTYIKIGQRVSHMKFGDGVVLSYTGKSDDLKLHINFESYGKKWLVLSYAQLDFLK